MCGLFGAIATNFLSQDEKQNVKTLGTLSTLRGTDSSGICVVTRKNNKKYGIHVAKDVYTAPEFFLYKQAVDLLNNTVVMISGHTRKATCGLINEANAQPIQENQIYGVHNGVIPTMQPKKEDEATTTDSRLLIRTIAEKGIDAALDAAGSGAFAIVYLDSSTRMVHFVRNHQRPLHFMRSSANDVLYWASEKIFLEFLALREGRGQFTDIFEFEPLQLYTLELGSIAFDKRPIKKVTTYPLRYHHGVTTTSGTITRTTDTRVEPVVMCAKCKLSKKFCGCQTSVPVIYPLTKDSCKGILYKGWAGKLYRGNEVIDILNHGCCICSEPKSFATEVVWTSPHKFVCGSCMKDRFIYQYMDVGGKNSSVSRTIQTTVRPGSAHH